MTVARAAPLLCWLLKAVRLLLMARNCGEEVRGCRIALQDLRYLYYLAGCEECQQRYVSLLGYTCAADGRLCSGKHVIDAGSNLCRPRILGKASVNCLQSYNSVLVQAYASCLLAMAMPCMLM